MESTARQLAVIEAHRAFDRVGSDKGVEGTKVRTHATLSVATMVAAGAASAQEGEDWNAKFQSTHVWQAQPAFSSPYEGAHSRRGAREKSCSFTAPAARLSV